MLGCWFLETAHFNENIGSKAIMGLPFLGATPLWAGFICVHPKQKSQNIKLSHTRRIRKVNMFQPIKKHLIKNTEQSSMIWVLRTPRIGSNKFKTQQIVSARSSLFRTLQYHLITRFSSIESQPKKIVVVFVVDQKTLVQIRSMIAEICRFFVWCS